MRNIVAMVVSALLITFSVALAAYSYFKFWTPIKEVYAEQKERTLTVSFKTALPTKTKIKYGTSVYNLMPKDVSQEYVTEHEVVVSGLLPKEHVVEVVAETEDGREFVESLKTE